MCLEERENRKLQEKVTFLLVMGSDPVVIITSLPAGKNCAGDPMASASEKLRNFKI